MSLDEPTLGEPVDELLATCLDGPPTEWAQRVEQACAEQPGLADELERRYERLFGLGILERPGVAPEDTGPERLGPYRLLRRVGGGGMGVVYEALDERLNRRVALKVVRGDQLFFAGSRQRFAREMQAASRLDHPNLCPIYEAGELDGVPYIAMRFVEGRSLTELLDERRREGAAATSPSRAFNGRSRAADLAMIEKLARALHAAHEAGLVHRDVKPHNVLVDRQGEPVLIDFGLVHDADLGGPGLTQTGDRLGTPAYMAPEQVSGRAVDRRTDVYGLGVTLYECLTLRCPFESAAQEDLYRQILSEPPPNPRAFDRGLGRELRVVLEKALEKRPERRFATAEELADELRRIREHEPIRSRRPGVALRAVRWSQRNRTATGVITATLIGLVASLWLLRQSQLSATRFRSLAWLQAAGEVGERSPELAFKYAREALRLHDDPVIVAEVQEILFRLREHTRISEQHGTSVRFSPDGERIVVTAPDLPARLYERHDARWREVPLPDTGWRATTQLDPPPASFSPDGRELALRDLEPATGSGVARRFELGGRTPRVLEDPSAGRGGAVWQVRYHPDPTDERFLVVREDHTALCSRADGTITRLERQTGAEWVKAAFLPNGRIVAAGGIWTADGELLRVLSTRGGVLEVHVAQGNVLIETSSSRILCFDFDGERLEPEASFPAQDASELFNTELDPTGSKLLVITHGGLLRLLDAATLEPIHPGLPWRAGGEFLGASFSPDGRRIAARNRSGVIRIWDLAGRLLDTIHGQGAGITLDWSPTGAELVSVGRTVDLWHLEVREGVPAFAGLGRPDVAASPSGDQVVFASDARGALVLCDERGEQLDAHRVELGKPHLRCVHDGLFAVGSEHRSELFAWDTTARSRGRPLTEVTAPRPLGTCPPALLPDGRWMMTTLARDRLAWRPPDGPPELVPNGEWGTLDLAVSEDGEQVAFGGYAGVRVWFLDGRDPWRDPEPHGAAHSVDYSYDGRHLLVASSDLNAYILEVGAPAPTRAVFSGHRSPLRHAVFSVDEERVATASLDGSIRVWERATARTVFRMHHSGVRGLAFTSSGQLVTAGEDGMVRWWTLEAEPLLMAVEALGIPELDEDESERVSHLLGR